MSTVQILDLVGGGTKVNDPEVVNAELVSGDSIGIGEIRILVEMEGEITATNYNLEEDDEVTDASVHTVGDIDFSKKSEQEIKKTSPKCHGVHHALGNGPVGSGHRPKQASSP